MSLVQWKKEYLIGIRKIDNQHKKIMGIVNRVLKQQFMGRNEKRTERILEDLQAYVKEHFRSEEEYMLEKNFAGYEEQRREHNQFIDRLCEAQKEYIKDGRVTSVNMVNLVWDWFSQHLLKHDQQLRVLR